MEAEHLPLTLEGRGCKETQARDKELLERLVFGESDRKPEQGEDEDEREEKKPRRKDTPVLNCPPHVPGTRVLQEKKQAVHLEEDEAVERE